MDLAYTRFDIRVSTISNLHVFMELIINPDILLFIYKYAQIIFVLKISLPIIGHVHFSAHPITITTGDTGYAGDAKDAGGCRECLNCLT